MSTLVQTNARVLENVRLADSTYRIRLQSPELARAVVPGQFFMLRLLGSSDPLLGRPFALYDTVLDADGQPTAIDIVYLVIGKLTGLLAQTRPGEEVVIWGPLGNGFSNFDDVAPLGHVALVAGGIGQTPFLAYARALLGGRAYASWPVRRRAQRVSIYYGVRTQALAAGVDDFRAAGADVHLASDDGSLGYRGYVTALLDQHPSPDHLVGCGPAPMLEALTTLARRRKIPCQVSLETPMACGVGICFSCVAKVRTAGGWDYARVCTDGPCFDAAQLVWER